jgi:membrane fusion protein (multidrug efflux system)
MLIGIVILFGGIFGFKMFQSFMRKKYMSKFQMPPVSVSVIKAGIQNWQGQFKAVGSLRAVNGVFVTSEVAGIVQHIYFKPGDHVKKGAMIVQLNADSDVALLHSLEAQSELAGTVYERDQKEFTAQAISKETLDAAQADMKSKRAQAEQQRALVIKKGITAPFDGSLGINNVNTGQYVNPGNNIVSLQSLDTLYLDFYLPQQSVSNISVGQVVSFTVDSFPDKSFTGKISCINPNIDASTRNIETEPTVDNPQHTLLPGMFVSLELLVGNAEPFLTVPQTAVTFNPYGDVVYLVDNDIAKQAFVEVGQTRGDQIVIVHGIKEGDTVVTAGQLKLKNGSHIVINNDTQPSFEEAPEPKDE